MNIYERNIKIFKENRILSNSKFSKETQHLVDNTKVFKDIHKCKIRKNVDNTMVSVVELDTISAIIYCVNTGHKVCALNFADALTPGGLVEQGELTQEEELCRCSNLYESLIKDECIEEYYKYNISTYSNTFSDRAIYSSGVKILRESLHYNLLQNPIYCDIVTCPAPLYSEDKRYVEVLNKRIEGILQLMSSKCNDTIILGAWGCGAFGGDALIVAKIFADKICKIHSFKNIVFAIKADNQLDNNYIKMIKGLESKLLIRYRLLLS